VHVVRPEGRLNFTLEHLVLTQGMEREGDGEGGERERERGMDGWMDEK
jgi:hypothetical protein